MSELQREVDWNGEAYHRLSDMQYKQGMELLATLEFKGNELVLDAGCGSGRITKEILERLPTGGIIGVDLSERMLATARREVVAQPGQRIEFIYADLQTFRPKLQVDGIFSNMALHFVADHSKLFGNFAQILKPGGFIGLQYGTRQTQHPSAMRLMDMLQEAPYGAYLDAKVFNFAGGHEATDRQALVHAGFVDISVEAIHMHPIPEQIEKMREFVRTTTVEDCVVRLPENLREQFRTSAEAALTEMFNMGYEFEYLQVRAKAPELH
jgi:trans-aconitate 2-methyltransferase